MVWKNVLFLAGLAWLTSSQAADPVVYEKLDDAYQQRIEAPAQAKARERGLAGGKEKRRKQAPSSEVKAPGYWKMQVEEPSYRPEPLEH